MTAQDIKKLAIKAEPEKYCELFDCFVLTPPVELIDIKNNRFVHATSVDENSLNKGCVELKEELYWWNLSRFRLPDNNCMNQGEIIRLNVQYSDKWPVDKKRHLEQCERCNALTKSSLL
jgi:hypothetical protein